MDLFFCRPRIRILTDQVVDTAGNKADHSHTTPERKKHKKWLPLQELGQNTDTRNQKEKTPKSRSSG